MSYYSSVIARPNADGFAGRYVHSASQPAYVIGRLLGLYRGPFNRDLEAMQRFLIDDHPGGWSRLGDDPTIDTGWSDANRAERTGFTCYCHGDRHETHPPFTQDSDGPDVEWLYVIGNTGIEVSQVDWGNTEADEDGADETYRWRHRKHVSWN